MYFCTSSLKFGHDHSSNASAPACSIAAVHRKWTAVYRPSRGTSCSAGVLPMMLTR